MAQDDSPTQPESNTMRAVVQAAYGDADVLAVKQVAMPEVGDDDVLVRVRAASVGKGDAHLLSGKPYLIRLMYGLRRPKNPIPGHAIAGQVESVGRGVTQFRPGDEVFGEINRGAFAEYACQSQKSLALKPTNLTFEQAAAIPVSGPTALKGLRDVGQVNPGHDVLINGASGGVGTYAIQIAKSLGANVTGVCSTRNVEQARLLGADEVIDYTQEDFVTQGRVYDVMFDVVGNRSLSECRRVLKPKGTYVASAGKMGNWIGPIAWMLRIKLASMFHSQRMVNFVQMPNQEDLLYLKELLEAGTVVPVIERTYTLDEVPDALRYLAAGHARGKVVISV